MDDPTTYLVSFDDAEARYVVFICLASSLYIFIRIQFIYVQALLLVKIYVLKSVQFQSIVATSYKTCSEKKEG